MVVGGVKLVAIAQRSFKKDRSLGVNDWMLRGDVAIVTTFTPPNTKNHNSWC